MFSKSFFGIIFAVTLIFGSLWFATTGNESEETGNVKKSVISKIKIELPKQKDKHSLVENIAETKKSNRILTPDELYEQRLSSNQTEFDLEPTIPEIEVMPEELKILEQEAALEALPSETLDVTALYDNPGQTSELLVEAELPPSEDFEEVIPFELERMELEQQVKSKFDNIIDN